MILGVGALGLHLVLAAAERLAVGDARAAALAGGLAVAVPAACVGAFRSDSRLVRAAIVVAVGAGALAVELAVGAVPAVVTGPGVADAAAVLALLGAIVLVGAGLREALRGCRRLVQVPAAFAAALLVLQFVVVPAVGAGLATSAARPSVPPAASLGIPGARDVTVRADDGVALAGWLVPGRNGAGVVLLHGAHASRRDVVEYLRLLAAGGYAVLAIDARGHGASDGPANALGWRGAGDVTAAARVLVGDAGVAPERVGAVGLSMGGEEALRAAASGHVVRAVVADGAGAGTLGDQRLVEHGALAPLASVVGWLTMRETELIGGADEPTPLHEALRGADVPVLLISSSAPHERELDDAFARSIGPRAVRWHVADAVHTRALDEHPQEYASRVRAFLERPSVDRAGGPARRQAILVGDA